ncbi:MAG: hypothetical protein GWN86_11695 [Desulfobacterales bacterium]|nr:hypothetical protein [Desulfobacterales bacterium]
MEEAITGKEREELQRRLQKSLKSQISHLSTEFQQILTDDLVTALQNRLSVLTRIQDKRASGNPGNLL